MITKRVTCLAFPVICTLIIIGFLFTIFANMPLYASSNATLSVTTLNDNGPGSLREAITLANHGDTIEILVHGTISLTNELSIAKDLNIIGSQPITISGNHSVRVFNILAGNIHLENLIIAHGHDNGNTGGGLLIANGTTVNIKNSKVHNNISTNAINNYGGGGIMNYGSLTITDSLIDKNMAGRGGGIFNNGTLTIKDSYISNNFAREGAGIRNYALTAVATIHHTVFANNTSEYGGGGISNRGFTTIDKSTFYGNSVTLSTGGGISNARFLTLTNSTLYENTGLGAGAIRTLTNSNTKIINSSVYSNSVDYYGGGMSNYGTSVISNSTFSHNAAGNFGGGIHNFRSSTLQINNSTFVDNVSNDGDTFFNLGMLTVSNTVATSNNDFNCSLSDGTFHAVGANIANDGSCSGFNYVTDVLLDSLKDNGGDTYTHALLPNSPAIDAGDCSDGPLFDQRGMLRPQDNTCDLGAYEEVGSSVYLPSILNHEFVGMAPIFIGNEITQRPVKYPGEVFYETTISIPPELPSEGNFYLSTQPNVITEVLIDDEIVIKAGNSVIFTHDFSSGGTPQATIIAVPRVVIENVAGQMVTVEYHDVYGHVIYASELWLIWSP